MMKKMILIIAFVCLFQLPASALVTDGGDIDTGGYDIESQLDAIGRDELMDSVPDEARGLMEEAGVYEMSISSMLQLSPKDFFSVLWAELVRKVKSPLRTLGVTAGILLLCALMNALRTAAWDTQLSGLFGTVSVLCVVVTLSGPVIDCVKQTMKSVTDASYFMVSFVPVFSASLVAAGQPATGATYNMFLFSACQVISQVVSRTLMPLVGIYLAVCIAGAAAPSIKISSAAGGIKTAVSWTLGLLFTLFVGLFSVQSIVGAGADTVTVKTAKFMISSFVPVVGSALSDAYAAAQGCLKLIKTSVGAYGIAVAAFTFLPALLDAFIWYGVTSIGVIAGDITGLPEISSVLKSCAGVLGILVALMLCYALLIIVTTTVILVTGAAV